MNNYLILPILIPFFTAVVLLLWRRPSATRRIFTALATLSILLVSLCITQKSYDSGLLVLKLGGWTPPFGIALTLDILGGIMLSLSGFIALMTILYGFAENRVKLENPLRLPLTMFLLAGMNMSFSTGDIFNLYVAFEVMLIASYALLTLEADNWDIKHALPYVAINLFGSALFLSAAALTYSLLGTLNYADIASKAAIFASDPRLELIGVMFALVFGIKAGMFPLYYWLPKSYPTLPTPLAALFGGMLTKVGVYAIIRLFGTILPHGLIEVHWLVLSLSAPTMIFGVLGAVSKNFVRGILSYHIISQVGYMLLAVGLFTPLSIAAGIFYIVHHIIVKSSLFLIGGIGYQINQSDHLDYMGHLWKVVPILGILFLIQALSLAGIPPLSGFWGKYLIIIVGLEQKQYFFVGVSIVASILTLISMLKIWLGAFWSEPEEVPVHLTKKTWIPMTAIVGLMTLVSLSIGFNTEFYFAYAQKAAYMVLDQAGYIKAVLQ